MTLERSDTALRQRRIDEVRAQRWTELDRKNAVKIRREFFDVNFFYDF